MVDNLKVFGHDFDGVIGFKVKSQNGDVVTYTKDGGGGSVVEEKEVTFYDYDGTPLYSYTAQEALVLEELPENPSHEGLIAQGWNYTLAQVKADCTALGECTVGQNYITDDNKTRIYISIDNDSRLSFYLTICVQGTASIDWGDNSTPDSVSGSSVTTQLYVQHTYASGGDYVISIGLSENGKLGLKMESSQGKLLRKTNGNSNTESVVYNSYITKVEIGRDVQLGDYGFASASKMKSISIPTDVSFVGSNVFYAAQELRAVVVPPDSIVGNVGVFCYCYAPMISLPGNLTSTPDGLMQNASGGYKCTIPSGVTSLGKYAIPYRKTHIVLPSSLITVGESSCRSLQAVAELTIPESVTNIGQNAFNLNTGMKEYHFLRSSSVPTLSNTNAFNSIQSDCIIYVPYSADHSVLNMYKTETNWSTYASYIQEEPQS